MTNFIQKVRVKLQDMDLSTVLYEDLGTIYPILVIVVGLLSIPPAFSWFGNQLKLAPVYLFFAILYLACDLIRLRFLGEATISLGFPIIIWVLLVHYPDNSPLMAWLTATIGSLISETIWSQVFSGRYWPWFVVARRAFFYASHHAVAGLTALVAYQFIRNQILNPWLGLDMIHIQATLGYTVAYSLTSMLLVWPHDRRIRFFLAPDEKPFVRVDIFSTLLLFPIPLSIFYLYDWVLGQTGGTFIVLLVLPLTFALLFIQARRFMQLEQEDERRRLSLWIKEHLGSPANMDQMTERMLTIMGALLNYRWGVIYSLVDEELELRCCETKTRDGSVILHNPSHTAKEKRELIKYTVEREQVSSKDTTEETGAASRDIGINQGKAPDTSSKDANERTEIKDTSEGTEDKHMGTSAVQSTVIWPDQVKAGGILEKLVKEDCRSQFFYHGLTPGTPSEPCLPRKTALIVFPIIAESQEGDDRSPQSIGLIALARPKKPFTTWDWEQGQALSSESSNTLHYVQRLERIVQDLYRKVEGFTDDPHRAKVQYALQELAARRVEIDEILEGVSETSLREHPRAVLESIVAGEEASGIPIDPQRIVEIYYRVRDETSEAIMPLPDQGLIDLIGNVTSYLSPGFSLLRQPPDVLRQPAFKQYCKFLLDALDATIVPDIVALGPFLQRTIRDFEFLSLADRDRIIEQLQGLQKVTATLRKAENVDADARGNFFGQAIELLKKIKRSVQGTLRVQERFAFLEIATNWQKIVTNTLYAEQKREVQLAIALSSNRILPLDEVTVRLKLENRGSGLASQVVAAIQPSEDYEVSASGRFEIDHLPAGIVREFDFRLRPYRGWDMLDLTFLISYYDHEEPVTRKFTDRVYLREIVPFVKIYNPYVFGIGLTKGSSIFFGRDEIFEFIRRNLTAQAATRHILLLIGARRMGKTSILKQLPERLKDEPYVLAYVDCQRMSGSGMVDLFWRLSADICEGLKVAGLSIQNLSPNDLKDHPQYVFEEQFLPQVWDCIGDRCLLLLIDEFDNLYQRVQKGRLEPEAFTYLRSLMQSQTRMSFVLAGAPELEELVAHYGAALFNLTKSRRVGFLERDNALRLITEPVAPYGLVYDDLAVDEILRFTAGHPYFLQLVCNCLVSYCNDNERNYVTIQDVQDIQNTVLERGRQHWVFVWHRSASVEKAVLCAMVDLMHRKKQATIASIIEYLNDHIGYLTDRVNLNALAVEGALERLVHRDVIQRNQAPGVPCFYTFTAHLYGAWVSKNKSLDRIGPELVRELS